MAAIIYIGNNIINLDQLVSCSFENKMATFHLTDKRTLTVPCLEIEFLELLGNSIKKIFSVKNTYAILQDPESGKKIMKPVPCAAVTYFDDVRYMISSGDGEMFYADQAPGFTEIVVNK